MTCDVAIYVVSTCFPAIPPCPKSTHCIPIHHTFPTPNHLPSISKRDTDCTILWSQHLQAKSLSGKKSLKPKWKNRYKQLHGDTCWRWTSKRKFLCWSFFSSEWWPIRRRRSAERSIWRNHRGNAPTWQCMSDDESKNQLRWSSKLCQELCLGFEWNREKGRAIRSKRGLVTEIRVNWQADFERRASE